MSASSIITLNDVTVEYSARVGLIKRFKHQALKNVSFAVAKGEVFGVLGRNGSGKSTLLQVLAGILKPDSGSISIEQETTRSLLTLGLGFNAQLSGRDNALISCMLDGYTKSEAQSLIEDIKSFSELDEFFERPVKTYSAGMRSRLGFATGLMLKVDLLLIDEVLSVGDQDFRAKAEKALLEKMKGEQTVIFVSHSAGQIQKLCSRCVWLDKGEVKAFGDTKSVMSEYQLGRS